MVDTAIRAWRLVEQPLVQALVVLLAGVLIGYVVGRLFRRLLVAAGVPELAEGTAMERSARSFGTSTVAIISQFLAASIYAASLVAAVSIARPDRFDDLLVDQLLVAFLPQLFVALLVLVVGFVLADKAEIVVGERLRSVKLPEVNVIPRAVNYSILFITILIALGQVGVSTTALLILLAAYAFGIVFVLAMACRHVLSAATAGYYLLLTEPYGIGDEIVVGDHRGIVQDLGVFVTTIESDEAAHVVPNHRVLDEGVTVLR